MSLFDDWQRRCRGALPVLNTSACFGEIHRCALNDLKAYGDATPSQIQVTQREPCDRRVSWMNGGGDAKGQRPEGTLPQDSKRSFGLPRSASG